MPRVINAKIIENVPITCGDITTMKLILYVDDIVYEIKSGQFINISVSTSKDLLDPILKRPISIHDINIQDKTITVIYNVVGKGTRLLSAANPDSEIEIVIPLGNGFNIINNTNTTHLLVGGGCGVAPLYLLNKELQKITNDVIIMSGFSNEKMVFSRDMYSNNTKQNISTDDGTYGNKGFVTEMADKYLSDSDKSKDIIIYACGPTIMMKSLYEISKKYPHVKQVQLSLENIMACGVGVCTGCVVKIKNKDNFIYKRVCKDGPVFLGEDLIW